MEDKISASEEVEKLSDVGCYDGTVVMEKGRIVEWLDLPEELWIEIGKHLNTTMDILRFRSMCKTWRFAVPHPSPHHTIFAPQGVIHFCGAKYFLLQTKIYRLEQLSHQSSAISTSKGWLVKFGESKTNPGFQFPFKHPKPLFPSITWPRVLDLIDFHVVELIEAYTLCSYKYDDVGDCDVFLAVPQFRRVVLVPSVSIEGALGLILFRNGKLAPFSIRYESVNWIGIYAGNNFDDIILHEGQVYIVDKQGNIYRFDVSSLSLNLVSYSNLAYNYGYNCKKHLVVSGGNLHVVDMYINWNLSYHIEVYTEVKGERWLRVNNLGDVSFVLGEDNFSVTAKDYYGFEGNCIYFYDPASLYSNDGAPRLRCFSLEKGMCA